MVQVDDDDGDARGWCVVVGNYCHDVLFRDGAAVGETLGGAAAFVSNVLDALLSPSPARYVAKVGPDFAHSVPRSRLLSSPSPTTLFHAHFHSRHHDRRLLRRVRACDPIFPSDLPDARFSLGLAVGVAGEILPETLECIVGACDVTFVDVQGLIRSFDPADGAVGLVPLRATPFFRLLPRIALLKASSEEAPFVGVEEARRRCCVVVTEGENGCRIYTREGELRVPPFPAVQVDPTGAGDSFLGGLAAGLMWGLPVPDAALLGNFCGALTVGQIGIPKFDPALLQNVKQLLEGRKSQQVGSSVIASSLDFKKSDMHDELQLSLAEAAKKACGGHSTDLDDNKDNHSL
ncbi:inositol 3-kinase isoform X2 [Ananas comosus]|uniref:Inositol 3-kinase n=2 Tax=Ananas comosus TaxID=4615 RepID=A0A199V2M4_ANACO|nr:inositol 3-kinase isoform X2 [Ananas comosus]OAY71151.1 Inositol 3-kinase [Ananas comosus]CAD1831835.1 unnamed protein product [Ananas comosus var. bracteatus]